MSKRRAPGEGTIFRRRGGGWAAALSVGVGPDGRQRRRYVYGTSQREVRHKLEELKRQRAAGLSVSTRRGLTIADYLTGWVTGTLADQLATGRIRESTRDSYADMVQRHITPYLGRYRVDELKPPHLRTWLSTLRTKTTRRGTPLSPRTVQLAHATLRRALNDAVRDELIPRNVALLVSPGTVRTRRTQPLTPNEVRNLLTTASADRLYALWVVLLTLGLRRGEALALRWSDLDADGRTVRISRSLQRRRTARPSLDGRRRTELVEVPTKTEASVRLLALPAIAAAALTHHRQQQRREQSKATFWADPDLIFTTTAGTQIDPQNVYHQWHALCDRAGVRRCRIHDLRHTAASLLLLQGAEMRTIMDQLGHSRMATTSDLYTHVLDEVKRDAANRMDSLLKNLLP